MSKNDSHISGRYTIVAAIIASLTALGGIIIKDYLDNRNNTKDKIVLVDGKEKNPKKLIETEPYISKVNKTQENENKVRTEVYEDNPKDKVHKTKKAYVNQFNEDETKKEKRVINTPIRINPTEIKLNIRTIYFDGIEGIAKLEFYNSPNVRSSKIKSGEKVEFITERKVGSEYWSQIIYDRKKGWIKSKFLK